MDHLTTTPFGRRPVTARLIARAAAHQGQIRARTEPTTDHSAGCDKWQILRDLSTARHYFGLSDRSLMVLNALISFHPKQDLHLGDDLIVFPSNRALSDRAHGMAESTLRRHLAKLVEAGILLRHDSPNGKRYARRYGSGDIAHAFGFDLTPLVTLARDIAQQAEIARTQATQLRLTRERISLLKRDAVKLLVYAQENALPCTHGNWSDISADLHNLARLLRRKLTLSELAQIEALLVDNLSRIKAEVEPKTPELSGSDSENERHYQSSNKNLYESEQHESPHVDKSQKQSQSAGTVTNVSAHAKKEVTEPNLLPLSVILSACSELSPYHDGPITNWTQLVETAMRLRSMMGISAIVWQDAVGSMGAQAASVAVACILQRFDAIRNPSGYLRALSDKAKAGKFSTSPMVMALLNTSNTKAA